MRKQKVSENTKNKRNKYDSINRSDFGGPRLRIILISLILLFVIISIFSLFIYLYYGDDIITVKKIDATINVGDYIGFNLDKNKLHFGTAFPGGKSVREMSIISNKEGYAYVTVDSEFKDWVFSSVQNEYVGKGTAVPFEITLFIPEDASFGNYTFEMNLFILEKKADFITKLILKSHPAASNLRNTEEGDSGRIMLEIINNSQKY